MNEGGIQVQKRWFGLILLGFILGLAILSFFYTPYDPNQTEVLKRFQGPSITHPFGTDHFGRDVLSRILVGGQVSLLIGLVSVSVGAIIGTFLGLWSGFKGGIWDEFFMRTTTTLQSFPTILFALLLASIWKPGLKVIFWAVVIGNIPLFLRLTRTQVLSIKTKPYIEAATALGLSELRIIVRHVLPNLRDALLVQFSVSLAGAILVESSLSYLGLGLQPPRASWGLMLRDAQSYASLAPWLVVIPGLFIALTVIGFNLLGDTLIYRR